MIKKYENDSQDNPLIGFLIEDLKDTGEYLRETDRKLSFFIQIYAGAFVLIATLSVNNVFTRSDFFSLAGLLLILIFIFFTGWLFEFSLRCKETKQIYIHRMNFLRREIHYLLQNEHKDLLGYWTSSELTDATKQLLSIVLSEKSKPKRVGLDDLYPNALKGILFLLSLLLAFVSSKTVYDYAAMHLFTKSQSLSYVVAMVGVSVVVVALFVFVLVAAMATVFFYTTKQREENERSIKYQIESYKISSEKKYQMEVSVSKERIQKDKDVHNQPNTLGGKRVSSKS